MTVQSKLSHVFSYESWIHAVSGAAGGCIAMSTFYPLDTVRSRLQLEDPEKNGEARSTVKVLKEIILNEGVRSLYRGLAPVLQSLCISNFVYFYTFHCLKAIAVESNSKSKQSALLDLLLGSVAGIINVLTTTPFWVVNTRLRMRDIAGTSSEVNKFYTSLFSGLQYIARTEGVRGLWSGTVPSLILVSNPALQFMMYEMLKRNVVSFTGNEISSFGYFIIGALAKAFATVLTYPLQLVQTKQRHRTSKSSEDKLSAKAKDIGMIEMMISILKFQGFKGLFRGLEAKILQTVLTAALMFTAYEKIAMLVGTLLKRTPNTVN
ncbi:peroxisomal membrane protein PMP34 [Teleopsis dalmanni]|uniref:peroxisomal membrane protein PMP34 n=1 Tax=Teleopsis dalmanni TaxID=139649 RepID=UPI0018CCEF81|nr:peroxisomal membrane protein PMP34 [Teleopsis dalmanni]